MKPASISQGERYAMNETINIVRLRQPDEIGDTLTDVLRSGARKCLRRRSRWKPRRMLRRSTA